MEINKKHPQSGSFSSISPSACRSIDEANRLLNEQGLAFNNHSILVQPNLVIIDVGNASVKIPMHIFKQFAEWYLEKQIKEG